MNITRAKEILESGQIQKVFYNNEPVLIQHINEENEMARVYFQNNTEKEQDVPLHMLSE